ncbi:MAG: TatD family hydrolase [Balneolaceae bacterium]|nr:TatD family hydrolase [Balneolaceae bacterium]
MIDTHCHLYLEHFEDDLQQVLQRAQKAGIQQILMPAINFDSLPKMDRLAHTQIRFHKMAGIHPTEINEGISTTGQELADQCSASDIIAVGETGLDYHWSSDFKDEQQKSLRLHCKVAKSVGKPVVLHNRESTDDLLEIIEKEQDGSLKGIWHCFNGSTEEGKRAIDLGLKLGIGGVLTFKNAGVDQSVAELPNERMMLETDAPYLSPEPKRGKRNEPAFVKYTCEKLANVQNLSFEEVEAQTTKNAIELFNL